jgi:hypothetical protein
MNAIEEINKLRKEYVEKSTELFKNFLKEFFENNEDVESITFTAYTPYFNDGDACTYSVGDAYLKFKETSEFYSKDNGQDYCNGHDDLYSIPYEGYNKEKLKEIFKEANKITSLPSDLMYNIIGDHAEVLITRDEMKVSHLEHD